MVTVRLQDKVSVFEWRQRQQTRSAVRWAIQEVLNELPEEPYPKDVWDQKVDETWQFIFAQPGRTAVTAQGLGR
jgi:type I restriction enzyme R subunit